MVYFYFKQAFRSLVRSRLISLGSLLTIFLGALSISLLFTYVYNELSMDKFHRRHDDIYMMIMQGTPQSKWDIVNCKFLLNFNYQEYPEIENLTTLKKYDKNEIKVTYNNSVYFPEGLCTDSVFFRVFSYKMKSGTYKSLSNPKTILLTESFAKKVFGSEDPLGKTIALRAGFEDVFTVTGILENPPSNSSIKFDFVFQAQAENAANFIMVRPGFDKKAFIHKIEKIPQQGDYPLGVYPLGKLSIVPLSEIYFSDGQINMSLSNVFTGSGDKSNLRILILVMIILLTVSALNFSNLQIVKINSSIKNIGINRIAGANRKNLIWQKICEVILLSFLAIVLLTIAYFSLLPQFNKLTEAALNPDIFYIALLNAGVIVITILLAMCYPSFLLLRLPIKSSLKNQLISNNKLVGRQVIIITQFTLTIGLLVTSFVVKNQINLMLDKDLGFHSENIIKTSFIKPEPFPAHPTEQTVKDYKERWEKQKENFQIIKNELSTNTTIESFAQFQSPIEAYLQPWGIDDGRNEFESQYTIQVSPNQLDVFNFKLVAGRFFDPSIDKERGPRVVVNEAALKYWGINDISKIRLKNGYQPKDQGNEIIGVVKDFNFRHLSVKPQPLVMLYWESTTANVFIRFKPGEIKSGLAFVKNLHDQFILHDPFKYTFLTEEIAALYNREKRLGRIYTLFTLIAFLISMSGLFVIALYDTERRKKEIGIRKVNGAKILEVIAMLNRDFVKWVAIAFVIATPIAYYVMNKWLENFAYKTTLSWWIFALSGILALGIALLTVSWQSWKAATRNPVEALRYE